MLTAIEPSPQHAQPSDELVARIDRDQIAARRARFGDLHQQRFNIVGKQFESLVAVFEVAPNIEVQLGLAGPGRARIEGDGASESGVGEEERHTDRDLQCFPGAAVQCEIREPQVPVGHRAVAQLGGRIREQQITGSTDAHQLPASHIDDVLVLIGDLGSAHFAALTRWFGRPPVGGDPRQHVIGGVHAMAPSS